MQIIIEVKANKGEEVYSSKTLEKGVVEELSIEGYPQGFLCWYKVKIGERIELLHDGAMLTKEEYKEELQRRLEDVK